MINPLTLLTSPLEKGLAVAVAALLVTSGSEALVIKYEMNSKTQCVSAVTATNAQTKTVTTAIRNVDNASNSTIQSSVSSGIATDLAGLRNSPRRPSGGGVSGISSSPTSPATASQPPTPATFTVDESSAEACLTAYDVAVGWQQWYNQTQLNWENIENNGTVKSGNRDGGTSKSTSMEDLRVSFPSPVWLGVSLGNEDVGKEQSLRDQGDGDTTRDGSRDTRSQLQGTAVRSDG